MHFDQQMMRQIQDNARNLESARKRLDAAEKMGADWDHIKKLSAEFEAAQNQMVQCGIQAAQSLPRAIKADA